MVQTKASVFEELLEWHKAFRCGLWFVRFRAWLSNVKHIEGNTKATKALLAFTFFVSCLYVSPKMYFISVFSYHRNLSQFYLIFVIRDSRFQTTDNIFIIRRGKQFAPFTTSPPPHGFTWFFVRAFRRLASMWENCSAKHDNWCFNRAH